LASIAIAFEETAVKFFGSRNFGKTGCKEL
jgi:hypothetical protein